MKVGIVILNYMNYKETVECVSSIRNQKAADYVIVVVDNGSDNESFRYLHHMYSGEKSIDVIRARKNYGFAKGNNIGIAYVRKKYNVDYVLLLNSDTLLVDEFYLKKMLEADEIGVGVIGSRIQHRNYNNIKFRRYILFPDILFYYIYLIAERQKLRYLSEAMESRLEKCSSFEMLQGCALMLTPSFFKYYSGLYPNTFLYVEEEFLYLYCMRAGLRQKRIDDTYLIHKGNESVKILKREKNISNDKWKMHSYRMLVWESFKLYLKRHRNKCG